MKTFNSSFAEIDDMELNLLLDLVSVHRKINEEYQPKEKKIFIDDIL